MTRFSVEPVVERSRNHQKSCRWLRFSKPQYLRILPVAYENLRQHLAMTAMDGCSGEWVFVMSERGRVAGEWLYTSSCIIAVRPYLMLNRFLSKRIGSYTFSLWLTPAKR
ncbi:MAG: hypothetical protein K8S87_12150 [Planctomycetes bacterium]|nr:hypothetical protein [Planctomycetota bacterium]